MQSFFENLRNARKFQIQANKGVYNVSVLEKMLFVLDIKMYNDVWS